MGKVSGIKDSIHNVESEKYANKTSRVKKLKEFWGRNADSFHDIEST